MFSPDQVREVLLSFDLSNAEMARQMGSTSREAVRQVRQGLSHRNVCPEIPRWHRRRHLAPTAEHSCERCQHWRGAACDAACDLGFPDPREEGLGFAAECCCYSPERNQAISAA